MGALWSFAENVSSCGICRDFRVYDSLPHLSFARDLNGRIEIASQINVSTSGTPFTSN